MSIVPRHSLSSLWRNGNSLPIFAYKEIADRMKISIDTVRSYVRTVYEKLHVHSRTAAVVKYLRG